MMDELGDRRPIPDPTTLTTAQLVREVAALEKLLTQRIDAAQMAGETGRRHLTEMHAATITATKEAVAKSDAAATKQIDQLGQRLETATGSLKDRLALIEARLSAIEGRGAGMHMGWGYLVGAAGLVLALFTTFRVAR